MPIRNSKSLVLINNPLRAKGIRSNGVSLYKEISAVPPAKQSEVSSNLAALEARVLSTNKNQLIGKEGFIELIKGKSTTFLGLTFDTVNGSDSGPFVGFAYAYPISRDEISEQDLRAIANTLGEAPKDFVSRVYSVFSNAQNVLYMCEGAALVSNTDKIEHAKMCAEMFIAMANSKCGLIAQIPKDLCADIIRNLQSRNIVNLTVNTEIPDFFGPGKPAIMFCGTFTGTV